MPQPNEDIIYDIPATVEAPKYLLTEAVGTLRPAATIHNIYGYGDLELKSDENRLL